MVSSPHRWVLSPTPLRVAQVDLPEALALFVLDDVRSIRHISSLNHRPWISRCVVLFSYSSMIFGSSGCSPCVLLHLLFDLEVETQCVLLCFAPSLGAQGVLPGARPIHLLIYGGGPVCSTGSRFPRAAQFVLTEAIPSSESGCSTTLGPRKRCFPLTGNWLGAGSSVPEQEKNTGARCSPAQSFLPPAPV